MTEGGEQSRIYSRPKGDLKKESYVSGIESHISVYQNSLMLVKTADLRTLLINIQLESSSGVVSGISMLNMPLQTHGAPESTSEWSDLECAFSIHGF